jgi:hypothetical protein
LVKGVNLFVKGKICAVKGLISNWDEEDHPWWVSFLKTKSLKKRLSLTHKRPRSREKVMK